MNHKLLFVDDERPLLNGISRRLGCEYDITTAESGAEGLQAIEEGGPFSVIFTDMRMPRMDGVEFAERAKSIAPESTFIMLTGNQDQVTAVNALNRGRVFRFLNKPCNSDDIRNAIEDGIRQYELVTSEKILLQKTFTGAVSVLTDVITASYADLSSFGQGIETKVEILQQAGDIDPRWEYKLAARLSPVGIALKSEDDRQKLMNSAQYDVESHRILGECLAVTAKMIRDIPRLNVVSDICLSAMSQTGSIAHRHPKTNGAIASVGGALLRMAHHWETLVRQGLNSEDCAKEVQAILPDTPHELREAIAYSDMSSGEDTEQMYEVYVMRSELESGMILADNVTGGDGGVLIRKGRRLNDQLVEKLQEVKGLRQVRVYSPEPVA